MKALVSGEWLAAHVEDVRVVDVRWYLDGRPGRDAYLAGHIPGAVWLDVDRELSEPATTADGRHPLATPQRFAAALGHVGISTGTPVVGYDDAGGSVAARLWWMLHVLGEPAAVLDGGLAAWPGALETDVPRFEPVPRDPVPWPRGRFVSADELAAFDGTVYDARTAQRFAAGDPAIDPRPGHIPGAISAPWADNLDATGRFRPAHELRARYRGPAVAYCGSGVTSCHDLLAMHLAGIDDAALYPGSWSQWGADLTRPTETGPTAQQMP
jgi:thiosulfate/3-mercaptopyruvate sulfurtransferase